MTLTFNQPEQFFSNGTSTPQGKQLCQTILEIMHECVSYGLNKLTFGPFLHLTFKCNTDLHPTLTSVSNGTSTPPGQQLCHIILKSMHKCTSYRCLHNACTYTELKWSGAPVAQWVKCWPTDLLDLSSSPA